MLTHEQIWRGVDRLALRNGLSPSGLAKRAGLDPTTFNKSKRVTQDGKQRWPGTESLSKILDATQTSMADFVALIDDSGTTPARTGDMKLRSIRLSKIGDDTFDRSGFPLHGDWEDAEFPSIEDARAYVVEIDQAADENFFRSGSLCVVSPSSSVRRHDRVLIKRKDGGILFGILKRKSGQNMTIVGSGPDGELSLNSKDVAWMARILWISQ